MANKPLKIHAQVNFVTVSSEEDIAAYRAGISLLLTWMREEMQKEIQKGHSQIKDFAFASKSLESVDLQSFFE